MHLMYDENQLETETTYSWAVMCAESWREDGAMIYEIQDSVTQFDGCNISEISVSSISSKVINRFEGGMKHAQINWLVSHRKFEVAGDRGLLEPLRVKLGDCAAGDVRPPRPTGDKRTHRR
jgi:hypothetical protein